MSFNLLRGTALGLVALVGVTEALAPPMRMSLAGKSSAPRTGAQAPPAARQPWSKDSWRGFRSEQLPEYPDPTAVEAAEEKLRRCAPLVFAGEMRQLNAELAKAQQGNGFLLMGGDCAESFDEFSTDHVRDTFRYGSASLCLNMVLHHHT